MKQHPWFRDFDWEKLYRKEIKAPFCPNTEQDNFDQSYTSQDWKDANSKGMIDAQNDLRRPSI